MSKKIKKPVEVKEVEEVKEENSQLCRLSPRHLFSILHSIHVKRANHDPHESVGKLILDFVELKEVVDAIAIVSAQDIKDIQKLCKQGYEGVLRSN